MPRFGKKKRRALLAVGILVLYTAVLGGHFVLKSWLRRIELGTPDKSYFHYDIVPLRLKANSGGLKKAWRISPPKVVIMKDGRPVPTVGRMRIVPLVYRQKEDVWEGRWPVPWNAPEGTYIPTLADYPELRERVKVKPFRIVRRRPKPIPNGFVALNLETANRIVTMRVKAPDGTVKGWEGLLDWAQYFKADAFWVLAGITPGTKPDEVWLQYNLADMKVIGRECHRRGLKFGVWAMCYLTAKRPSIPRYEYALEYEDGRLVTSRAISLQDPRRPGDIAAFLKRYADMPEVDYIGLDYIRNALGGYELAQAFFREMPGAFPPEGWEKLSEEAQRVHFVRKKILRKDKDFIDRWQWWRAHRVAEIVRGVRQAIGEEKTLWAFTLGWERGWQHGQDPVMMSDAGIDVDAVMLYEATRPQFDWMVQDWRRYVGVKDVQLIVADVIDWPLHQNTTDPSGPEEYHQRTKAAIDGMYRDGRVRGIFIHDLARLLTGRKGPYPTEEWAEAVKRSITSLRGHGSSAGKENRHAPDKTVQAHGLGSGKNGPAPSRDEVQDRGPAPPPKGPTSPTAR